MKLIFAFFVLYCVYPVLVGKRRWQCAFDAGPASSRCNRCGCIGPLASGGPAPWWLGRLFIFARYSLCTTII